MIKVGSDFSGVGAFDQALIRLGINYETIFACDMDKYARQTYIHNYGEPKYYPSNVYDREIPKDSIDIYMTSPPCQAFSLAGKRKGENDDRGVLFYNSHEFIQKNKPRYFIFENVKGLLSDDGGKTFQRWVAYLGGKSVNGNPTIFSVDEAVPYHIYYKVLNAKNYGVPQNRERIFIVGIRDDEDNTFRFPKEERLIKRLKDILEYEVDEKYYLSDKLINFFIENTKKNKENGNGFAFKPKTKEDIANSITTAAGNRMDDNFIIDLSQKTRDINVAIRTALEIEKNTGEPQQIDVYHLKSGEIRPLSTYIPQDTSVHRCVQAGQPKEILIVNQNIRKLTERECFRLMDFPCSFNFSVVSMSQAYKQAGNSIVVAVLEKIIKNLKL